MHIEFYGATSGITGSCHILRANHQLVLLDCGLIQGRRDVEARNREPFPFLPNKISAVVLSHGHIDHSGRIPLLIRQGYRGPIYVKMQHVNYARSCYKIRHPYRSYYYCR